MNIMFHKCVKGSFLLLEFIGHGYRAKKRKTLYIPALAKYMTTVHNIYFNNEVYRNFIV